MEPELVGADVPASPGTPKNLTPEFEAAKEDPYNTPGHGLKTSGKQLPNWHDILASFPLEPTTPEPPKRPSMAHMDSAETIVFWPNIS